MTQADEEMEDDDQILLQIAQQHRRLSVVSSKSIRSACSNKSSEMQSLPDLEYVSIEKLNLHFKLCRNENGRERF